MFMIGFGLPADQCHRDYCITRTCLRVRYKSPSRWICTSFGASQEPRSSLYRGFSWNFRSGRTTCLANQTLLVALITSIKSHVAASPKDSELSAFSFLTQRSFLMRAISSSLARSTCSPERSTG
ncbi:hypothetical protein CGCVW01_v006779 [Colletotrichum viniferum]|nr:hypothetical protein CGCVW01_v006779 [Colletotrichum viniferum]